MAIGGRLALCFMASLALVSSATSQERQTAAPSAAGNVISLDVVVTPKHGPPIAGLQKQDFTLLDNKVPEPIGSFRELSGSHAPIEITLVLDTVNTSYIEVANERREVDLFLRDNGGRMAYPTTLAYFTDAGIVIQKNSSTDGNALSADLDSYVVGLRGIRRSSGFYGAAERYQMSIDALRSLAGRVASLPGRKVILWVSPGWPFLSGPHTQLSSRQQQRLFASIVNLSTGFRKARITLYSIDPLGAVEGSAQALYYENFVKGVRKVGQADPGDLGLQVLAVQSGGLALNSSNDIAALLKKCLADTESYYEISFAPTAGEHGEQYHHLQIRMSKRGLTARTRDGYYWQP